MPLTAYRDGTAYVSTELAAAEFDALRGGPHLTFRCGVRAIPRRSRAGLPHFYHQSRADCQFPHTNPETDEHRAIKSAIIRGAIAAGWSAEEEFPSDDWSWKADVLVTNGVRRIAFEAQWSKQTDAEFRFRTNRYRDASMETVWLYRHADADDSVDHGLIPIRKRDDGVVVAGGESDHDGMTVEHLVVGLLRKSAWWKFERSVPETTVTRWSAIPCLGCGAVNVRALGATRMTRCTRCNHAGSAPAKGDSAAAMAAAHEAGVPNPTVLAGCKCGACGYGIGQWAVEVAENIASFISHQHTVGMLMAHWCIPGHDISRYSDIGPALTAATEAPSRAANPPTPAATVLRAVAEVKRRLDKGAEAMKRAREKDEFMASPAGVAWLKGKRSERQSRRDREESERLRQMQKRLEDAAARRPLRPRELTAAETRALLRPHQLTMMFKNELRKDGMAAARLVAEHGRVEHRCPCPECEDFRARLSALTIAMLFAT